MGTLFRSHPDWKMCEIVDYNLIIQRGMVAGTGLGWAGLGWAGLWLGGNFGTV